MGTMTNWNTRTGKLMFFFLVLAVLAGFQPGFAEAQDIEQLRKAAEQGDASAQVRLGGMYYIGWVVPRDYQEAAKWFRKAAEQGNAMAQVRLGELYYYGEGVPQDYREAVKWGRKAAEQGDARAQYSLGMMYRKGEGVSQDYVKAYAWYHLASAQGDKQAAKGKDMLRGRMTAEQVAEAQKLAAELWDRIESSKLP